MSQPGSQTGGPPDATGGRAALRKVRDAMRPGPDFGARLERALAEAVPPKSAQQRRNRTLWTSFSLTLPAALSVVVSAYVACVEPTFDTMSVAEHQLDLPKDGKASLTLDLALHHHGSDGADIAVSAPRSLTVFTHDGNQFKPSTCRGNRCRYELRRNAPHSAPSMQVRLTQSGRYRMEIEHHSPRASVREVFVIHARR